MTIERKIILKNSKDVPISIMVSDQFPKSSDERIKIDLMEPVLGQDNAELKDVKKYESVCQRIGLNNDTKNMEWEMIVQPNKEISIPFIYSVTWPSGSSLDNSNL